MFLVTQYFQISEALADLVLAALVNAAPAAILDVTSKVHLYKVGPTPTFSTPLSAYTECDFMGYAAVTLATTVGPFNLPNGRGIYKDTNYLQTTGTSTAQSALGMFLTDTTDAIYYGAEQFVTPAPFNIPGDDLQYQFVLAPKSLWGGQPGA